MSAATAVATATATATATLIEDRVVSLERAHYKCPPEIEQVDESMRRAREEVESLGLYSSRWMWVPEPYYTWPLEKRAAMLKAPATGHLCKALLLENKKVNETNQDFWLHPRFVMVVLQYDAELSTDLLTKSIRRLRPVEERLDPSSSNFDWRVADPEDNDRITGYQFNSVTPLVSELRVVLCRLVSSCVLRFLWIFISQQYYYFGRERKMYNTGNLIILSCEDNKQYQEIKILCSGNLIQYLHDHI